MHKTIDFTKNILQLYKFRGKIIMNENTNFTKGVRRVDRSSPIAVMDSGVGGISVLSELFKLMPNENYIYYGDSANAPYGTKNKSVVLDITRKNLEALMEADVKAAVIACNTATSAAAGQLRVEYPDFTIIGIEPAIKPASILFSNPRVLVMATPLTLHEEKFQNLCRRYAEYEEIVPLPCPGLVELIEAGKLDCEETDAYLRELFAPHLDQKVDAVVLGCTHYPHIKTAIARCLPLRTTILDGGEGTARETFRRLKLAGLLNDSGQRGEIQMINSSDDERLVELSWELLERGVGAKLR